MAGGGGDDAGATAYPVFVDILSSTLITFVFFVLVVAAALFFHMVIFKGKVEGVVSQLTQENVILKEQLVKSQSSSKCAADKEVGENQLEQERSQFSESKDQKVIAGATPRELVVFFGYDSISLTEETQGKVALFIATNQALLSNPNLTVKITAGKNPAAITEKSAQTLSLARMLNVRNMFLKTDVPLDKISPRIVSGEQIEGSDNWVKIEYATE